MKLCIHVYNDGPTVRAKTEAPLVFTGRDGDRGNDGAGVLELCYWKATTTEELFRCVEQL